MYVITRILQKIINSTDKLRDQVKSFKKTQELLNVRLNNIEEKLDMVEPDNIDSEIKLFIFTSNSNLVIISDYSETDAWTKLRNYDNLHFITYRLIGEYSVSYQRIVYDCSLLF